MNPETDLHSSRMLRATPERVFAAITDADRLARWWGPAGFRNRFDTFEFRPGGNWIFDMIAPDGTVFPNESRFVEIIPNERVVIEHIGTVHHFFLTITLSAKSGRTRIDWLMRLDDAEERERTEAYAPACNEELFDRLEAELSRDEEPEVMAVVRRWHEALTARDLDSLSAAYRTKSIVYDLKLPWQIQGDDSVREMWDECLPCFPEKFNVETRDVRAHVSGDLAVVHWLQRLMSEAEPDHPAVGNWMRASVALRRDGGDWFSVHDHVSVPFDPATGMPAFGGVPEEL